MPKPATKQILGSAPYFLVADVKKAAEYYRDVLGFSYPFLWGEPPSFAMPKRDGHIVMRSQFCDAQRISPNRKTAGDDDRWDAYFWVLDAEALFREFQSKGANVVYAPTIIEAYDMKEFAVQDLDGYVLAFGQDWSKKK